MSYFLAFTSVVLLNSHSAVNCTCYSHTQATEIGSKILKCSLSTELYNVITGKLIGKDAGSVGGLSSTYPKTFNPDLGQAPKDIPDGEVINIMQDEEEHSGKSSCTDCSLKSFCSIQSLKVIEIGPSMFIVYLHACTHLCVCVFACACVCMHVYVYVGVCQMSGTHVYHIVSVQTLFQQLWNSCVRYVSLANRVHMNGPCLVLICDFCAVC
jgi:hypothetical protein